MRYLMALILALSALSIFQSYKILSYRYLLAVDEFALHVSGRAFQIEQELNHRCQKKLVQM